MNIIILQILVLTSFTFAQVDLESEMEKEKAEIDGRMTSQQSYSNNAQVQLDIASKKLAELKAKEEALLNYEQGFSQNRIVALSEIEEKIKSFSVFQKLGSKIKFYKCLRSSIESGNHMNSKSCEQQHYPSLSNEEKDKLSDWKNKIGLSLAEAEQEKSKIPQQVELAQTDFDQWQARKLDSDGYIERLRNEKKLVDVRKEELKLLEIHKDAVNCDANTKEINLEAKGGPFDGIPRDNQDGIGSCYANAAKNLLVGISGGEDVASFLDLALIYKDSNSTLKESGLDGGLSCYTLNAAKEVGYCPQKFAPMEIGEQNIIGEGLFNQKADDYMATNISMVKDFINGLSDFEKLDTPHKERVLANAKTIVDSIKSNPNIKIPLPVVRVEIPRDWKLKEFFVWNKDSVGDVKEEAFNKEYAEHYKNFYPLYIKAVLDGKNQDQIFDIYKASMAEFITKYKMEKALPDFKRVFLQTTDQDFKDPKLKNQLSASIEFLKGLFDKMSLNDESFFEFCSGEGAGSLKFLTTLQPLIEKIKSDKLNDDQLFTKDGKFKSARELMQLTVAPACLNQENRKPLPPYSCKDGYNTISNIKISGKPLDQQHLAMRRTVVMSLVQGYPLGNTYPTSPSSGHINTIVGLKYNPQTQKCQYLIRESQTGTSGWQDEDKIFSKIEALTEVRKLK